MPNKQGVWSRFVEYLGFGPEEEEYQEEMEEAAPAAAEWPTDIKRPIDRRAPVVPITAATQKMTGFKVMVVEPRSFEEVQTIVDQMRARRPVILNLESLDKDLAQKILNFLNGAIYALGGETQRVAQGIFFFAPPGTDVATMGRGLTGTAIGGGAVDLPPGLLEKLAGLSGREESPLTMNPIYTEGQGGDLTRRATGRRTERQTGQEDGRPRHDWRNS